MKKSDDATLTIAISKGPNNDLFVDCDLSYIDNLGDCAEEHGEEEKGFVNRSIVLLRNIVDDVVRSWESKGGDVTATEESITSKADNGDSPMHSRLRKRKALNYDESRMLTSSQLLMGATSTQDKRERKIKKPRSLPSQNENWKWEPQIVLDVQKEGDSWELHNSSSVGAADEDSGESHAVTIDEIHSQDPVQLGDELDSRPGPSALVGLNDVMIAESQDVGTDQDESCWIRPSTCMDEVLQTGRDLLKETEKHIEEVEKACGRLTEDTSRKDQSVNTEDVADLTDNTSRLSDSAIAIDDESAEGCLLKMQKITGSNSAEESIEGSSLLHKGTSTTCDVALDEIIFRIMQGKSNTSVSEDSSAARLSTSPPQSDHSPTTSHAVSQDLQAVQLDEEPVSDATQAEQCS